MSEHDNSYPNEPIGDGNPYYCCAACKRSAPAINGYVYNHFDGCSWVEGRKRPPTAVLTAADVEALRDAVVCVKTAHIFSDERLDAALAVLAKLIAQGGR